MAAELLDVEGQGRCDSDAVSGNDEINRVLAFGRAWGRRVRRSAVAADTTAACQRKEDAKDSDSRQQEL